MQVITFQLWVMEFAGQGHGKNLGKGTSKTERWWKQGKMESRYRQEEIDLTGES